MFVLVDGHTRLVAALESGVSPSCLLLYHVEVTEQEADNAALQRAVEELALTFETKARSPKLTLDRLNQLAIEAWTPLRHEQVRSRGRAIPGGYDAWQAEVTQRLDELATDAQLDWTKAGLLEQWQTIVVVRGKVTGGRFVEQYRSELRVPDADVTAHRALGAAVVLYREGLPYRPKEGETLRELGVAVGGEVRVL